MIHSCLVCVCVCRYVTYVYIHIAIERIYIYICDRSLPRYARYAESVLFRMKPAMQVQMWHFAIGLQTQNGFRQECTFVRSSCWSLRQLMSPRVLLWAPFQPQRFSFDIPLVVTSWCIYGVPQTPWKWYMSCRLLPEEDFQVDISQSFLPMPGNTCQVGPCVKADQSAMAKENHCVERSKPHWMRLG